MTLIVFGQVLRVNSQEFWPYTVAVRILHSSSFCTRYAH